MIQEWVFAAHGWWKGASADQSASAKARRISAATDKALGYFFKALIGEVKPGGEDEDGSEGGRLKEQRELLRPPAPPGGGPDHAGGVSEVMRRFDDKMNRKMHSLDASLLRRAGDGTRWGQAAGVAGE